MYENYNNDILCISIQCQRQPISSPHSFFLWIYQNYREKKFESGRSYYLVYGGGISPKKWSLWRCDRGERKRVQISIIIIDTVTASGNNLKNLPEEIFYLRYMLHALCTLNAVRDTTIHCKLNYSFLPFFFLSPKWPFKKKYEYNVNVFTENVFMHSRQCIYFNSLDENVDHLVELLNIISIWFVANKTILHFAQKLDVYRFACIKVNFNLMLFCSTTGKNTMRLWFVSFRFHWTRTIFRLAYFP